MRHAVELCLKYFVGDLAELSKTGEVFAKNHALAENWALARKLLTSSQLKVSDDELGVIDKMVAALDEIDPRGETFRYPESFKQEQHLKEWNLINFAVLGEWHRKTYDTCHSWHHRLEAALGR